MIKYGSSYVVAITGTEGCFMLMTWQLTTAQLQKNNAEMIGIVISQNRASYIVQQKVDKSWVWRVHFAVRSR